MFSFSQFFVEFTNFFVAFVIVLFSVFVLCNIGSFLVPVPVKTRIILRKGWYKYSEFDHFGREEEDVYWREFKVPVSESYILKEGEEEYED